MKSVMVVYHSLCYKGNILVFPMSSTEQIQAVSTKENFTEIEFATAVIYSVHLD